MFRTLILGVALGAVVCASAVADIRVFVTSSASGYGLDLLGPQGDGTGTDPEHEDWPIDPFRPTYSTVDALNHNYYAYDYHFAYYRAPAYPPIDAPSGTVDDPILIDVAASEWGYIWFQFRAEPKGARLNGLQLYISEAGSTAPPPGILPTYYVQNNKMAEDGNSKRWDGYAFPENNYADWHLNPQTMVAVTARGIRNGADDPVNMFDNQAVDGSLWTGVALLGAVQGAHSDTVCELRILNWGYAWPPYPSVGESCFFRFTPEPPGAFLILVASAWLRGRRP
jgi:hypothetical protein